MKTCSWFTIVTLLYAAADLRAATNFVAFGGALTFRPKSLTINAGDTVVWTNASGSHTVTGTGSDPICGSDRVPVSCSHTFSSAGTFPYICIPHQSFGMTGVVIVASVANTPPTVSITTPADRSVFAAPANVTIQANPFDPDGPVANVQFFAGANLLGADTTTPFSIVASNLAAGGYALSAVATDNSGLTGTSSVVNISVVAPVAMTLSAPGINNGQFLFTYTANAGLRYVIENSTNLAHWTPLTTNSANGNSQQFGEAFDVKTLRFYRVGRLPNP